MKHHPRNVKNKQFERAEHELNPVNVTLLKRSVPLQRNQGQYIKTTGRHSEVKATPSKAPGHNGILHEKLS